MKQLLILSGKGGTGKTTVATAFIHLLKAKAFADCDVDAPNLHLLMKPSEQKKALDFYGMKHAVIEPALCQGCDLCRANCRFDAIQKDAQGYFVAPYSCEGCGVCEWLCPTKAIKLEPAIAGELSLYHSQGGAVQESVEGTYFSTAELRMGQGTSGLLVSAVKKQLKEAVLSETIAIIDGSPGIGCPVIASISGVEMVLIVAEPSLSGISDFERILSTTKKFKTPAAVCVNKYDTNLSLTQAIKMRCEEEQIPFAGLIPYDLEAVHAINQGLSIVQKPCSSGRAVREVFEKTFEVWQSVMAQKGTSWAIKLSPLQQEKP